MLFFIPLTYNLSYIPLGSKFIVSINSKFTVSINTKFIYISLL